MAAIHYEEHWKDKCLRYINSINPPPIPVPGKSAAANIQSVPVKQTLQQKYCHLVSSVEDSSPSQCLKSHLVYSSVHGLPFAILSRSRYAVILWCVLVLSAIAFFLYTTTHFVKLFSQSMPVIQKTHHANCRLSFPAITLCNGNILRRSVLKGTRFQNLSQIDDSQQSYSLMKLDPVEPTPLLEQLYQLESFAKETNVDIGYDLLKEVDRLNAVYGNYVRHENDWQRLYRAAAQLDESDWRELLRLSHVELRTYGHQRSDVIDCKFNQRGCNPVSFKQSIHSVHGNCHTFDANYSTLGSAHRGSSNAELQIIADVQVDEYIGFLSRLEAIKVFIHPHDENYYHHEAVMLAPGNAYFITLKQRHDIIKTGKCQNNASYSIKKCTEMCLLNKIEKYCHCSNAFATSGNTRCNPFNQNQFVCKEAILKIYAAGKFHCDCLKPCRSLDYEKSISNHVPWPSQSYMKHFQRQFAEKLSGKDADYIRENLAMIKLSMNNEECESTIQEEPYEWPALLADIGGISAIFVGISVLTLAEFIHIIARMLTSGRNQPVTRIDKRARNFDGLSSCGRSAVISIDPPSEPPMFPEQHPRVRPVRPSDVYLPPGLDPPPTRTQRYRDECRGLTNNHIYERVLISGMTSNMQPLNVPTADPMLQHMTSPRQMTHIIYD